MNRFNNKKYYKPPPVKISTKLKEKPKEEWNSNKSDLNKYKLSNAEILKKKINATSKNLEEAKRDWQGQIALIQNGKKIYYDEENEPKFKIVRKKIDLTPMNRFEKKPINIDEIRNNERNSYQNQYQYNPGTNKIRRPYSGYGEGGNVKNKIKKNNSFCKNRIKIDNSNNYFDEEKIPPNNNTQENNNYYEDDDDGEIKMIYNTGKNANVIETKINNQNNLLNNDITNNAVFNEFEKTIQKMQEHLQKKRDELQKLLTVDAPEMAKELLTRIMAATGAERDAAQAEYDEFMGNLKTISETWTEIAPEIESTMQEILAKAKSQAQKVSKRRE